MKIKFNQQFIDMADQATLIDFLQTVNLHDSRGLAVAVNQKVITKANWSTHLLKDQDDLMVIKATQGG
jgi:sulfur carrier protein